MTTFPLDSPEAGPASVVASADAVLGELDEVLWAARDAEALLQVTVELERLRSHLAAVEAPGGGGGRGHRRGEDRGLGVAG